jgi:hypothetical protein
MRGGDCLKKAIAAAVMLVTVMMAGGIESVAQAAQPSECLKVVREFVAAGVLGSGVVVREEPLFSPGTLWLGIGIGFAWGALVVLALAALRRPLPPNS